MAKYKVAIRVDNELFYLAESLRKEFVYITSKEEHAHEYILSSDAIVSYRKFLKEDYDSPKKMYQLILIKEKSLYE